MKLKQAIDSCGNSDPQFYTEKRVSVVWGTRTDHEIEIPVELLHSDGWSIRIVANDPEFAAAVKSLLSTLTETKPCFATGCKGVMHVDVRVDGDSRDDVWTCDTCGADAVTS